MKQNLKFVVNGKQFVSPHQFLTGLQIKEMALVPPDTDLFLVVPGYEDELIGNETPVNLARPGIECFLSRKRGDQQIIVNGTIKLFRKPVISYDEVVLLAFPQSQNNPDVGYTVNYSHGPHQNPSGILPPGAKVVVKHNMKFDVTATHKS